MPFDRTLAEVLGAHGDALRDDLRKCLPATVTAVDNERQTVDVQVSVQNPVFDEYGNTTFEKMPSFRDVPLVMPRGGGYVVWMPVAKGDSVLLVFSDLSTDTWRAAPPGTKPVQPGWVGKHTTDSPFAIPCIAPDTDPLSPAPLDIAARAAGMVLGKDGSPAQIQITPTGIVAGSAAPGVAVPVALAPTLAANLAATYSALAAVVTALQKVVVALTTIDGLLVPPGGATAAISTATSAVADADSAASALATPPVIAATLLKAL